jgi:hypothetical protein
MACFVIALFASAFGYIFVLTSSFWGVILGICLLSAGGYMIAQAVLWYRYRHIAAELYAQDVAENRAFLKGTARSLIHYLKPGSKK